MTDAKEIARVHLAAIDAEANTEAWMETFLVTCEGCGGGGLVAGPEACDWCGSAGTVIDEKAVQEWRVDQLASVLSRVQRETREAERERCARVCDAMATAFLQDAETCKSEGLDDAESLYVKFGRICSARAAAIRVRDQS